MVAAADAAGLDGGNDKCDNPRDQWLVEWKQEILDDGASYDDAGTETACSL